MVGLGLLVSWLSFEHFVLQSLSFTKMIIIEAGQRRQSVFRSRVAGRSNSSNVVDHVSNL